MTEATKIRAQLQGGGAIVRMLVAHEMESGQRHDSAGKVIPAWHIQELIVQHNGKTVLSCQWGPAVSKNPFLQLTLKSAKAGDKVSVSWRDNRGATRTDEATIA